MSDDQDRTDPDTPGTATPSTATPSTATPSTATPSTDAPGAAERPALHESAGAPDAYQAAGRVSPWGYVFFTGLFLFAAALFWWYAEDENTVTLQVFTFVALVLTLAPIFWHAVDVLETLKSRRGLAGGFVLLTIVLGVGVMGLVSAVNLAQGERLWSMDTTSTKRYTLSDATLKLLDQVEGTVYATYLGRTPRDPDLRAAAIEQIEVFGAESPNVQVRVFDAYRDNQDTMKEYLRSVGAEQTTSGEVDDVIIFTYAASGREPSRDKLKELRVESFTWLKQSALGEMKWLGEQMITESIVELLFRRYKAYMTGGHGERSPLGELREFRDALRGQNVEVDENPIDLRSTNEVPKDCDVLMILDPQSTFAAEEVSAISAYLETGRTLFVTADVMSGRRDVGLQPVLDQFGLYSRLNYVVMAPMKTASGPVRDVWEMKSTLFLQPTHYADHPAVSAIRGRGFGTLLAESTFVEFDAENPPEGVTVEPLIYAPFQAGLNAEMQPVAIRMEPGRKNIQAPVPEKDIMGKRLAVAAVAVKKLPTGPSERDRDARVVYVGDTDFLTDRLVSQVPTNLDLALGMLQWGIRRESLIAVSERTIERQRVTLDDAQLRRARAWPLFVALLSLIIGGVVWWARRR